MDTDDADIDDFEVRSNNVVDAIEAVESAVAKVERAINDKWSSAAMIGWIFLAAIFWDLPGNMWHSKWRYEIEYSVAADQVVADTRPHDCAFLAAPLGEKYCHYDREVSTWHRATSTTGNQLVSYDDSKIQGVGYPIGFDERIRSHFSLIPDRSSIFFRINTCKSVSKQTTLTPFRISTYAKPGEGDGLVLSSSVFSVSQWPIPVCSGG
jgi:hypothetical protein